MKMPNVDFAAAFDTLQQLPAGLGNKAFGIIAGVFVPHAARMGFRLEHLSKKNIAVTMPDKRSNRNHLESLHAMALAHLGEFTCGLLLLYAVSPGHRTIIVKYEIEYLKKARGPITGRATLKLPKAKSLDGKDVKVQAELTDAKGAVVATVTTTWRVGKIPS
jgi:acyl-coenzyme A thioesterase PaaI-like protein